MTDKKYYISKGVLFPKIPTICRCGCNNTVWGGHDYIKGHNMRVYSYIKGKHRSAESKNKQSISNKIICLYDKFGNKEIYPYIPAICSCGCNEIIWDSRTTIKRGHISKINPPIDNLKLGWELNQTKEHKLYLSRNMKENGIKWGLFKKGKESSLWKGGKKIREARANYKRLKKGFIILTFNNPYNEPIDYHHIDPNLPYVVPCPTRIHEMFTGKKNHYQLVNAWIGIVRIGE